MPISRIPLAAPAPAATRVLVVDDDPDVGAYLVDVLARAGMVGEAVTTAAMAERVLSERLPDVLIIDRNLSDGDGLEICRTIKSSPRTWFVPVVGISGDYEAEARLTALEAGVDLWLVKPVEVPDLLARVRVLARTAKVTRDSWTKAESLMEWRDWVRYLVHDLRSPVSIAMGQISVVSRKVREKMPEAVHELNVARAELWRVSTMLQDLLDADRLQRGLLVVSAERLDYGELAHVVGEKARVLADLTGDQGHAPGGTSAGAVVVSATKGSIVQGDRSLLERTLINLVGNALRYRRVAPVLLEVVGREHDVLTRVMNDGPAIPESVCEQLFEPWRSVAGASGATGLGMAFCRMAVEAHGGRIWLESPRAGEVVFAFTIPRDSWRRKTPPPPEAAGT